MIIKCGACDKDIEIEGSLIDGQHVCCPFCGEKTVYRRPVRIEVPIGARQTRSRESSDPAPEKHEGKPKLGIKRPAGAQAESVDLNAQSIMRKMQIEEAELAEAEKKASAARRKAMRELLIRKGLIALVIAAAAAGGVVCFMKFQRERRERAAVMLEKYRAEEEQAKRDREAHQATAEVRLAKREAERAQRAEDAKRQQEEYARQQAERAAKDKADEARREAQREAVSQYRAMRNSFYELIPRPWASLPKGKRPGAVDGQFVCAIPSGGSECDIYHVDSKADGNLTATQLGANGERTQVEMSEYETRLTTFGGLVCSEGLSYVFTPKATAKSFPLPVTGSLNPSALRLGPLAEMIARLRTNTDKLAFDVKVNVVGKKTPIDVATLNFDEWLQESTLTEVLKSVAATMVRKPLNGKGKRKTVVLYDGNIIKRQMNVTLVPRNPTRHTAEWDKLYNEAVSQEGRDSSATEAAQAEYRRNVEEKVKALRSSATLTIAVREK